MPYTTITTINDGDTLSATWLNVLAANANYLGGLGTLPNVAFTQWRTTNAGSKFYHIRHRHRYLKAYYESTACDYIKIYYNGTLIKDDGDPDAAETYSIDLNNTGIITPTPTIGQWYEIEVKTAFLNTSGELKLKLMWESATA